MPVVGLALAGVLAMAGPAAADVVPFVDCVAPGSGTVHVYFGYANDGSQQTIAFGNQNQVTPGVGYQGQPTVFNQGTYQRVFRASWNQEAFPGGIRWELNGHEALATRTGPTPSPTCIAGETGPASDLTPTTARLSAVVGVAGQQTSYDFEYGAGTSLDRGTPPAVVGTGQHTFVTEELTGLSPGTAYEYRVVATDEDGTTQGQLRTFTTPVLPTPPAEAPGAPEGGGGAGAPGAASATPGVTATTPGGAPFAISVHPAPARWIAKLRGRCAQRAAAGLVITSNRAGEGSIRARAGKLTVATRHIALADGRNILALCLDKSGRKRLGAGTHVRRLRARVVVAARAGAETARGSAHVGFTRGG